MHPGDEFIFVTSNFEFINMFIVQTSAPYINVMLFTVDLYNIILVFLVLRLLFTSIRPFLCNTVPRYLTSFISVSTICKFKA